MTDLVTDLQDDRHCFLSLALHQTAGATVHYGEEDVEEFLTFSDLADAQKSRRGAFEDLVVLLGDGGEINEKSAAHVRLKALHPSLVRRFESVHQKSTVLQEPSAANFFGGCRVNQSLVQVSHCFVVVGVHGYGVDGGEKLGGDFDGAGGRTLSVHEIVVEENLKRIDGELKLSPYLVDKLEFDARGAVFVPERQKRPLVLWGHDQHHISNIRLLQEVPVDALLGRFLGEEI